MKSVTGFIQVCIILIAVLLTLWAFSRVTLREMGRLFQDSSEQVELVVMLSLIHI